MWQNRLTNGFLAVVADDITGAAELAAIPVRYGLKSEVVLWDGIREPSGTSCSSTILAVDTNSRSLKPSEAARRVKGALEYAMAYQPIKIFKKVDSVLRGPVLFELREFLYVSQATKCLLVPCNPTLGRTIKDGIYLIDGVPIDKTQFSKDPEYPRLSARIEEMMEIPPGLRLAVARVGALPDADVIVGEASTNEEILAWARMVGEKVAPAGGSDFFAACLRVWGIIPWEEIGLDSFSTRWISESHGKRELFVCGSASESTATFVAEQKLRKVPVFGLPAHVLERWPQLQELERIAEEVAAAFHSHQRVILAVGLPRVSSPGVACKFAEWLSEIASISLPKASPDRIYVEGGATAVSLAKRMNWQRLEVVGELARGVVVFRPPGGVQCDLVVKPGSYLWPIFIRDYPI